MKLRLALLASLFGPIMAWAQGPLVQIQNIQGWQGQFLPDSCNDGPNPVYLGNVVRVRGIVITPGGLNETSGATRWIWIKDISATPSTPYANISVRSSNATTPTDINSLVAGDTIEVIGVVEEFNQGTNGNAETQIAPSANGVILLSELPGPAPLPVLVEVGELNGGLNANQHPINKITTGEKYEGNFVEIRNVTVVAINPTDPIAADRCRLLVKDANNNHIWIYDRFRTQRPSRGFIPPQVGDVYTSVRGIIESWKNGCPGTNATLNRGYNLNPFSISHYTKGASAPAIGLIKKSVVCPSPTSAVTISAEISDDGSVISAQLFYSKNGGASYKSLPATASGTRYSATIPAIGNDTIVRYYWRAVDNLNNTSANPNVPGNANPLFYAVNTNGCTIKDIQFTPFPNGASGYTKDTVTVQGIVTANVENNLGYVYIQQPGQTSWAGIWVLGGSSLLSLSIGDLVSVRGIVEEINQVTRINEAVATVVTLGQTVPAPVVINPANLTTYNGAASEQYESMFVKLENPTPGPLFVVDTNADAAAGSNFGEYRIGADVNDPNTGTRIQVGRQTATAFSSLNVSYVNSPLWAINVPTILVTTGSTVNLIQGILTYGFGNMKLLPRNNADFGIVISNKNLLSESEVSIFPNPASTSLNILLDKPVSSGRLEIMSIHGQKSLELYFSGTEIKASILNLPSGLYQVRISDDKLNTLAVRKVSVVK